MVRVYSEPGRGVQLNAPTHTDPNRRGIFIIKGMLLSFLLSGLFSVCNCRGVQLNTPTVTQDDLTNLSLEELMKIQVVYAASKHEQKLGEAPSSITIITGDDIRKYGYRTLADILQSVRGFYVTYDRDYDYVGVRGFGRPGDYNTRVLLLVDGVRVNENVYDMAPIGTDFPMDIDLIERVEIIRGPSSSLYGTNAFFGVINVVTKPCPDLTGFQAQGGAGSHGAYKGRCSYGHEFSNGVELFLSGSGFTEQGQDLNFHEFNDPMIHNGIAEGCDGSKYQDYLVKSSYRGFNVLAGFSTREKHVPTGAWGTVLNDPRTRTIDERGFLAVEFQRTIRPEMELLNRVCFQNYHYDGYYVFDYAEAGAPPELMVNIDRANGQWWGGESALNWNVTRKHHFTLGTEIRYNTRIDQVNYDEGSNIYYLDDHQNSTIWALFGEDEFHLRKELILNAGVRYDNYETFGGATNPRLGVIYSPFKATNFKLLYGAAFRAPNAYELYYNDGGNSQKGNPDLSPERIQTYEAIWEQYFGEHFRSEMSVYRYTIRDLISLTIDPTDELLVFRNVDRIDANGVEMELEYKSDNGFAGRMSHSFQLAKNRTTGAELTNSPRQLSKLNLTLPVLRDQWFLGWETMYTSRRKTVGGHYSAEYFLTNLTLLFPKLLPGLEFSTSLYNLFDVPYGDPGSEEQVQDVIAQDGREFRVQLTYEFSGK